ncbi:hypothetical protein SZN_22251 [Streptomyces zinciresistens K42]|uniref:Uncharacterized protein n=1 Tax=Streptomyces zinciresistens K42 TaxID=700597 RepID=G2GG16_9ACTN|nr:hypothetical protein SZN_22251 [Streptomyces zinciresistens K42]
MGLAERLAGMGVAFTRTGVAHERNEADQDAVRQRTTADHDGRGQVPDGVARGKLRNRPGG